LNHFVKMFVLNVLKVDNSNVNYRNQLTLTNKSLSVREPGSNVSIILRFLNNYGSEEEKKLKFGMLYFVKEFAFKVIKFFYFDLLTHILIFMFSF